MKQPIFIISLFLLLLSHTTLAQEQMPQRTEFLGKIRSIGGVHKLIRSSDGNIIPIHFSNQDLENKVEDLLPGDEALVAGHINYITNFNIEGRTTHQPILIIDSLKPVSLTRLGKIDKMDIEMNPNILHPSTLSYAPSSIPVTTEVASAIMLTSVALMPQSLTADVNRPKFQDLNIGVFLFSGLMATGIFIFEQMNNTNSEDSK
jgi:hypothetical protein